MKIKTLDGKTVIYFILCLIVYAAGFVTDLANPDLWGYLSFGRLFWTESGFPYHDVFSYMPVKDVWVYHEWLTGVVFYPMYTRLGPSSLQVLRFMLAFATLWLVYDAAVFRKARSAHAIGAILVTAFAFCAGSAPVRAQAFTYFFFALLIFLYEAARERNSYARMWLLPPVFVLWSNLHGGFAAGLCITALMVLGEALSGRRYFMLLAVFIASVLSTLINPYGLKYWTYMWDALTMPRPDIGEWMSVARSLKIGFRPIISITWCALTAIAAPLCIMKMRKDIPALLILGAACLMSFLHVRHIVFFGLAFVVYLSPVLSGLSIKGESSFFSKAGAVTAGLLFFCLAYFNFFITLVHFSNLINYARPLDLIIPTYRDVPAGESYYPVEAVQYLKKHGFSGNILTEFDWGQYIMWTMPECKVGMDGRYETVYPREVHEAFFDFTHARTGWQSYLSDNPHEAAVLNPRARTKHLVSLHPEWEMVYIDKGSAVFIRKSKP